MLLTFQDSFTLYPGDNEYDDNEYTNNNDDNNYYQDYRDGTGDGIEAYEDEETSKYVTSGSSGIVFDHVDFVLLRLKHISMRVTSNITEILALQWEEFEINVHYKVGWDAALKMFNNGQKDLIFSNTSSDSIARRVHEAYHIALIAYTLDGNHSLYAQFNRDTLAVCSGPDIDSYPWKSYFKLLQIAIETLGTKEARWTYNKRFLYRGAKQDFVLKENQTLAFQHFVSTSATLLSAEYFAGKTLFEFHGFYDGAAMAVWDHAYFPGEQEVLFSPLQAFRVDSIHVGRHYTRYVLVKHEISVPCDDKENEIAPTTDADSLHAVHGNSVRVGAGTLALLVAFMHCVVCFKY